MKLVMHDGGWLVAEVRLRAPLIPKKFFHTGEVGDPHDLAMELPVDGAVRRGSHSERMAVTIPEIVSHYSSMGYRARDIDLARHRLRRGWLQRGRRHRCMSSREMSRLRTNAWASWRSPVVTWDDAPAGRVAPARRTGNV